MPTSASARSTRWKAPSGFGGGRVDVWLDGGSALLFGPAALRHCDLTYTAPLPNLFSFNSPLGACDTCRGFGRVIDMDLDLIIPDPGLSLAQGAIKPWGGEAEERFEYRDLSDFCRRRRIPLDKPFEALVRAAAAGIIDGSDGYYGIRGFFEWLEGPHLQDARAGLPLALSQLRSVPGLQRVRASSPKPCSIASANTRSPKSMP
jgi:hypothetical protein